MLVDTPHRRQAQATLLLARQLISRLPRSNISSSMRSLQRSNRALHKSNPSWYVADQAALLFRFGSFHKEIYKNTFYFTDGATEDLGQAVGRV
jgi:hypothetical protein